ncbi:hypothetical protein [Streptomyces aquilus]|uniref:hypothetical protein n=1 Tax=Streptomyces aquilus TaxID=2548456 RepID=UPI00367DCE1A
MIERAQGFLRPGERVRQVMVAQGGINPRFQIAFLMAAFIGVQILSDAMGLAGNAGILMGALGGVAGGLLANGFITRRAVSVTDQDVVVLAYGRFGGARPTRVAARLPQGTRIGPMSGTWAQIELAGERLWVHKKWQGDAAAFTPAHLG